MIAPPYMNNWLNMSAQVIGPREKSLKPFVNRPTQKARNNARPIVVSATSCQVFPRLLYANLLIMVLPPALCPV